MGDFNINTAGFVIVGLFVVTWVVAMAVWRFADIESKWEAGLATGGGPADEVAPRLTVAGSASAR